MEERVVKLDRFKPRDYQIPIFDALENKGYKRIMIVFPRRAGKDLTAFNVMIRAALKTVGVYYYIFPTYSQAKKAIWDSITNDGVKFLDFIPEELVVGKNSQEMKITFANNSIIQFVGSTDYDRLMGTNPRGCIFSEYAMQDPRAYQFIRPILTANGGWAIFVSTPRGKHNALYDLYQIALNSKDWFTSKLTIEETKHIPMALIDKEREEGIMSEDLIQQEYFTSFDLGIEGGYYTKIMDKLKREGHVTNVPHENGFKVHTAWDIGVRDSTSIIFFQTIGQTIRVIDYYENSKEGLEHYVSVLRNKEYIYGKHIGPHDIRVREFGSGITRFEKARQLGVTFIVADNISIEDGIEAVRSTLPRIWFDESKTKELVKALDNYRQEFDAKKKIYHPRPYHNWASHACFVGNTKILTKNGEVRIDKVTVGMFVKTPTGYKKILNVHKKLTNELCDVSIGKSIITCTPDHKFFTNNGLISAKDLTLLDIAESNDKLKGWIWKRLYGYFSKKTGLSGFKRTILSLNAKPGPSLMDTFINGMADTMRPQLLSITAVRRYIGQYGLTTTEKSLREWLYTTKTMMLETIQSKILRYLPVKNTPVIMQKNVHQRELEIVTGAKKNIRQRFYGNDSVLITVKQGIEQKAESILGLAIVLFAKLYSLATSMQLKKHAVKNVRLYSLKERETVYDLTIEDDNCYYASGYLVSNCDCMRYLAVTQHKTREGSSPEDLDKRYREAMYGSDNNLPDFFR